MTRKQKKMLCRILSAGTLLIAAALSGTQGLPRLALFLLPYAVIGWDVLWRAARNILNGQIFDENFLMAVATLGALGCGEYPEAVAVMLFYQTGELFQSVAVGRARRSISDLMDIRPDVANVERDGQILEEDPETIEVGETIVVKVGERIPLDGQITDGSSTLDTAALTGESVPRNVSPEDEVVSGCVNLTGVLRLRVTKPYEESTVAKILDLVENASSKKAKAEHFITKFARYYTPCVVFAALALALLPPLMDGRWQMWIQRALIFLVVSCPCALVISIPLTFFGGIGGASRHGILIKGGNYLEALAQAGIVVFDKTGTLTQGSFSVTKISPVGTTEAELLELAALAEHWSDHPISRSIRAAYGKIPNQERVGEVQETAGHGVRAIVDGNTVLVGSSRLLAEAGIQTPAQKEAGTVIHVASDNRYLGSILISDQLKPGASQALRELKSLGIEKTVMLTGDTEWAARSIAAQAGVDEVRAELLPHQKVEEVEGMLSSHKKLVFVGDGINDAPVLSRADIGVAMGALGSDAAIEAADVVLMDDQLEKLPQAIRLARKTQRIVRENIVFALGVKFLVLLLSAFGYGTMWMAVFADVGVSVIAILNAGRMLRTK